MRQINEQNQTDANWGARPIPEPGTMLLVGSGLIGLLGLRRKFKSESYILRREKA
jgi:hypothetical protein